MATMAMSSISPSASSPRGRSSDVVRVGRLALEQRPRSSGSPSPPPVRKAPSRRRPSSALSSAPASARRSAPAAPPASSQTSANSSAGSPAWSTLKIDRGCVAVRARARCRRRRGRPDAAPSTSRVRWNADRGRVDGARSRRCRRRSRGRRLAVPVDDPDVRRRRVDVVVGAGGVRAGGRDLDGRARQRRPRSCAADEDVLAAAEADRDPDPLGRPSPASGPASAAAAVPAAGTGERAEVGGDVDRRAGRRRPSVEGEDPRDVEPPAAVVEEGAGRQRELARLRRRWSRPPKARSYSVKLVTSVGRRAASAIVVADDVRHRAVLGAPGHPEGAGRHALDRPRAEAGLLDVDAGSQVLGHGRTSSVTGQAVDDGRRSGQVTSTDGSG